MTNYIDLIYCSGLNDGQVVLAYAPMTYISKGDIVCIDGMTDFYMVLCTAGVTKDSDSYKFITEALGEPNKVTNKYSHKEVEDSDYE